jgi:hypothetical protein
VKELPEDLSESEAARARGAALGLPEGAAWMGVDAVPRTRPSVRAKESPEAGTPPEASEMGGVDAGAPADWTKVVSI